MVTVFYSTDLLHSLFDNYTCKRTKSVYLSRTQLPRPKLTIARDQYRLLLSKAQSSSNSLVFNRGVPLGFHDEYAICRCEVETAFHEQG